MPHLYSTKVTAIGGRNGSIRSNDGLLALSLALPKSLGGIGGATNPEQLFAGGYSACFENALLHVSHDAGVRIRDDAVEVTAEVGLDQDASGAFVLSVVLAISIRGVECAIAEDLVQRAHRICPYSNAIKGNIDVATSVSVI